jgi:hypothetical protein
LEDNLEVAYLIVEKQKEIVKVFEKYHEADLNGFLEYYKELRHIFKTDIIAENYHGISRNALFALDSENETAKEYLAQSYLRKCITENYEKNKYPYTLIESESICREVFARIENKEKYQIIKIAKVDEHYSSNEEGFLGFDVGYWGGDNFSIISDSMVLPHWHGAPSIELPNLLKYSEKLNRNVLFENYNDANLYRNYYLAQDWAEQEMEIGEICIQSVVLI